jgi:hypothetical protein
MELKRFIVWQEDLPYYLTVQGHSVYKRGITSHLIGFVKVNNKMPKEEPVKVRCPIGNYPIDASVNYTKEDFVPTKEYYSKWRSLHKWVTRDLPITNPDRIIEMCHSNEWHEVKKKRTKK